MAEDLLDLYGELFETKATDMDLMRENANINGDTAMGTMLRVGSEGSKEYVLSKVIPEEIAQAHINGDIHIHDLDFYMTTFTCCQIDLKDLLTRGFTTGHGFIRPPKNIRTAANLACIVIQSNQNDMFGGQSVPAFDYALAPFVEMTYDKHIAKIYDGLDTLTSDWDWCTDEHVTRRIEWLAMQRTKEDTFQAMEALVHNLNTMHSRAGAQVPFSSLNYGTDTSWSGRMVTECLLDATEKGLGDGETPIFPVQIFKCKLGVNMNDGDPNYDLFKKACAVSAKRLFPNFSFIDSSFNAPYYDGTPESEVAYMGCRTRVIGNVCGEEQTFGRGNLSFTSINLPRLGIEAKRASEDNYLDVFLSQLGKTMDLVMKQLLHRYSIQSERHVYNHPFLFGEGVWKGSKELAENDTVGEILKEGTLSIGFIGLAEAMYAMCGKTQVEEPEIGERIVRFMRHRCDEYTERYGMNVTLLATPAEGLSGRFVKLDKLKYGEIYGVTDRDYYTNSFHVPVYKDISAWKKLTIEGPYHKLCNAGHISYIEMDGDPANNLDAFECLVLAASASDIGYFAINHPLDRDPVCGYVGIIKDVCPRCGRHEFEAIPENE